MTAPGPFEGFGQDLVAFYEGLAADCSSAYWRAHRHVYDTQVRGPLEALVAALEPEFGAAKVFRPQRDVRFSTDKRPYSGHASAAVARPGGGALYLQVSHEQLLLAGGLYSPAPDQLARLRRAVDAGPAAVELDRLVAAAEGVAGLALSDGDPLRTAPRGWPRDHPRIDLLRRRSLTLGAEHEPAPWWSTPHLLEVVQATWRALLPLDDWCARHVGPSTVVRDAAGGPR